MGDELCHLTKWSPQRKSTAGCAHSPPSPLGTCELLTWAQDAFRRAWGHADRWQGRVTCHRNGMCFKGWVTGSKYSSRDVRTAVWPGCLHRRSKEYPFASHCSSGCEELGTWHLYGVYMIKALSWHYLIKQHSTLLRRVWPSIHWWESRWGKLGVLATSASARISHLPSQCLFL